MRLLRRSIMDSFRLSDNLDFCAQLDPSFPESGLFDFLDQGQHVTRGGTAFVHDEIAVHFGNLRVADIRALEPEFIDQLSSRDGTWILEDTTCA